MSEGINVNTPTSTESGPISVGGGGGVTSFDELEALDNIPKAKESTPKPKPKSKEKDEDEVKTKPRKEKEDESQEESQKRETSAKDKKEKIKDVKDDEEAEPKEKSREQKTDTKDADKALSSKVKTLKLKAGDNEIPVRSDALVDVVVNGEKVAVPIQDLVNNFSGKVVYEKKFNELTKERDSFYNEKRTLQENVDKLYKLAVEQNKPFDAIDYLVESLGGDGHKVIKDIRAALLQEVQNFRDKSPEEIEAFEKDQDLQYYKNRESARQNAAKEARARAELDKRIQAIQEAHGLSEQDFFKAYDEVAASGKVEIKDINPEMVGEFYAFKQTQKQISDYVTAVNSELENPQAAVKELMTLMKEHKLSMNDVKEIASEVYGTPKTRALAKKIRASEPSHITRVRPPTREPINFDEL